MRSTDETRGTEKKPLILDAAEEWHMRTTSEWYELDHAHDTSGHCLKNRFGSEEICNISKGELK